MFVYFPHLDYDPQRFGPSGSDMPKLMGELDRTIGILIDACEKVGARPWVISEYGHLDTPNHCLPNLELRKRGMLEVRDGPFGEALDTYQSRAFAVVDHQLAHVYVRDAEDIPVTRDLLGNIPGVAQTLVGSDRKALGLDHPRSGEIVLVAKNDSWFAYPYWLDDKRAPDFARTIDIHRKPGYDPCELFVDPQLRFPMVRIVRRLLAKKMGFRTLFDIIPLNPSLVKGSHGIACPDPLDRPVWIGSKGLTDRPEIPMTGFRDYLLEGLGCADE
jgi:predicted AlkP superfamily pyrophosphatase or phosphodiesterase